MLSEVNDPSRSTNERFVYGIAGDNEGGIWVTTFYGGVRKDQNKMDYYEANNELFEKFTEKTLRGE